MKTTTTQTTKQIKTYYRVHTVCTSAALFSDDYTRFDDKEKYFSTMTEVRKHLKEVYGNCRRVKMYCESNWSATPGEHCGWIYSFRNKDWSHDSKSWNQKDWVTVTQIYSYPVIP
jgi:hypothetical protein